MSLIAKVLGVFFLMVLIASFGVSVFNTRNNMIKIKEINRRFNIMSQAPKDCFTILHKSDSPYGIEIVDIKTSSQWDSILVAFGLKTSPEDCRQHFQDLYLEIDINYSEVVSITLMEALNPLIKKSTEIIPMFLDGLTSRLYFWQYIPILVLILLFLVLLFIFLVCLSVQVFFGYDFTFLGLIKFRKNKNQETKKQQQHVHPVPIPRVSKIIRTPMPTILEEYKPKDFTPTRRVTRSLSQYNYNYF